MHALSKARLPGAVGAVLALVVSALAVVLVGFGEMPSAHADTVKCVKRDKHTGICLITVTVPGPSPSSNPSNPPTGNTGDSGAACYWDGTSQGVKNPPPGPVPCHSADGYWSNTDHCYISPVHPPPPVGDPSWQGHQPGDGAIYNCNQPQTGMLIMIWSANPPAGPGQQITPQQVAKLAIKRMNMTAINVGLAPTPTEDDPKAMGVIGVPVWMWVANPSTSTYGPITASASAGGITVTATATVERVEWNMGDGSAPINCGQGTPYNSGVDGTKPSPDCGYTYQKTSWDKPNHEYTVTANSYWKVDWAGAGQQGTIRLPALTSTVHIREGELQVLNNNG